jgi:hypothetical protein
MKLVRGVIRILTNPYSGKPIKINIKKTQTPKQKQTKCQTQKHDPLFSTIIKNYFPS